MIGLRNPSRDRTVKRFTAAILALVLIVGLSASAAAGQFEDGVAALRRGDYAAATRLLGPLAEKGDARAQMALGVGPAVKGYQPAPPTPSPAPVWLMPGFIVIVLVIGGVAAAVQFNRIRNHRARLNEYIRNLPPEVLAGIEHANHLAQERPWQPIAFNLNSVEMMERGVRLLGQGEHLGHQFSFGFALTMSHGPVAICEWSRNGAVSDGLVEIFAHYADEPRGDARFDETVKASAIILQAEPSNVPFAQIIRLRSKIFFEFAEDNPEIFLDLDFGQKTGLIQEKDASYRGVLVRAFQAGDQREETATE